MSDQNYQPTVEGSPKAKERVAPVAPAVPAPSIDTEMRELELTAKRLEVEERMANLQDAKDRLAERKMTRETKEARSRTNGQTIRQTKAAEAAVQKRCNHKKGGMGAQGILLGQGDDSQYAVLKHTMPSGDMWVRCLRCGKTWKPPLREEFDTEEDYLKAYVDYQTAVNFQTRNVPSSSIIYRFSDNGAHFRHVTKDTTLR